MSSNQLNKNTIWNLWQRLDYALAEEVGSLVSAAFHDDIDWNGPQPINRLEGVDGVMTGFWDPLRRSFPDLKRDTQIFLGGTSGGDEWVSGLGYLTGTFVEDWLDIPATGEKTNIHFGQFYAMRDGKAAESYLVLDVPAVMRQAGYDILPPSRGRIGGKTPGPANRDGVLLTPQDELEGRKTAALVEAMLTGLERYVRDRDGSDMSSMQHSYYWHPDFHWYGPTGIGTSHSIQEFIDYHQWPWLRAFGDRGLEASGGRSIGLERGNMLAEGHYSALGVWDAPFSVNYEPFLGVPASGKITTMRDFDWYRRDGRFLVQNWVPMDVTDILLQLGIDVFEILRRRVEERRSRAWYE